MKFSGRVGRIIHAFVDEGRKAEIRALCKLAQHFEELFEAASDLTAAQRTLRLSIALDNLRAALNIEHP